MLRTLGVILSALGLALLAACGAQPAAAPQPAAAVANISVQQLKQKLDSGEPLLLLDVRTPEEYAGDGHVAGSKLLPLQELAAGAGSLPKDTPIACICRSGNRSRTACDQLAQLGFTGLLNVEGGMGAWAQAGYPVEKP